MQSRFPLVVMVEESIYTDEIKEILHNENILVYLCEKTQYSLAIQKKYPKHSLLNTASKIAIFKLKEYDKLVYIDADCIVYKNIDNLFNYPDGAMYDSERGQEGFSGLMVIVPSNHKEKYYEALLKEFCIFDGDLFHDLFFPFKTNPQYRIPFEYFVNFTIENMDNLDMNAFYCVHFCYNYKPWLLKDPDYFIQEYQKEFVDSCNINRYYILKDYYHRYLIPLMEKYPILF